MIKFIKVEELPRAKKAYGYIDGMVREFMNMNVKLARKITRIPHPVNRRTTRPSKPGHTRSTLRLLIRRCT